jgi:Ser/Thr protein kinase RdoA (MazF antagonist)
MPDLNADIQAVLDRYPADCRLGSATPLSIAGGFSGASIWKLTTQRGPLALRRWPAEHPRPDNLAWIHSVAAHSLSNGFRLLAQPIPTSDGSTFVHHAARLWELTPWLPGEADRAHPPKPERLQNALRELAAFHRSVATYPMTKSARGPSPNVVKRRRFINMIAGDLAFSNALLDSPQVSADIRDLGRQFLTLFPRGLPIVASILDEVAQFEVALQPTLRDIRKEHVFFVGDDVTGIIDLGAMRIESPASDIARLLGSFVGNDAAAWDVGLAAYETTRPLDEQERLLATAIAQANVLLAPGNWLQWLLIERRTFDDMPAVVERLRLAVDRLRSFCSHHAPHEGDSPIASIS